MRMTDRVAMTLACRDAEGVPKVRDAGRTMVGEGHPVQIMHNGLMVAEGAYHGDWMAQIISGLQGHHEPQEECVFHRLVGLARPRTTIVELASFWAYYTLWYLQSVPTSRALCIEPDPNHMAVGRRNAALNGATDRIRFIEAWAGGEFRASHSALCESTGELRTLPCLDMKAVIAALDDRPIELLHMDAQGAELGFLRSMQGAVEGGKVRFVMVSTHHASISGSLSTHADCLAALRALGAVVLLEFDVSQSFSGDGLIAASFREEDRSLEMPSITRNRREFSLFPEG
jgi:methyltransferase FkbM-like protein